MPVPAKKQISSPTASQGYRLAVEDMSCASCVARVEKTIRTVEGVTEASVNLVEGAAYVIGGDPNRVAEAVTSQGYPSHLADQQTTAEVLLVFDSPLQQMEQDMATAALKRVSPALQVMWRDHRRCQTTTSTHPADLLLALQGNGFAARIVEDTQDPSRLQAEEAKRQIRQSIQRAALAAAVGFGLMFAMHLGILPPVDSRSSLTDPAGRGFWLAVALLCLFTMAYSGYRYYSGAWKQARHRQANMDTLVAVGTAAAWLSSVILIVAPDFIPETQRHVYLETSVLILAFLQFGHALEIRARARTGKAISALIELAPKTARILRHDKEVAIPVSLLRSGDIFVVRPGETIATDGTVVAGSSSVNESMITGEALPVAKQPDAGVTGGTLNQTGLLRVRVDRVGEATTLASIIQSVKRAQMSKPPIGRQVDKVAAVFVPIVLVIAAMTFASWLYLGPHPQLPFAITTAIAVLVIACPCALGLATPIAIMVGMGRAAQLGILIRNGDALQSAAGISRLIVDKTGTLTEGQPRVTDFHCSEAVDEERALQWAASLETASEHPLAQAIVTSAAQRGLQILPVQSFHAEAGQGVRGTVEDRELFLGRRQWIESQGIGLDSRLRDRAVQLARRAVTPVWLADETRVLALLGLRDPVRKDTPAAIEALHSQGIEVVMCTGDHAETAQSVARELRIRSVHSRVLPEDKADVVRKLQQQGLTVGMVGDGVNDAPALAQAQVGFAIGGGTDVAIQSADITLASNSLASVATAISLSRATLRNIRQNLLGAFIYNIIGIPLAAGLLYPWSGWLLSPVFASVAMALSSVTVVTNANRLRFFNPVE
jgi:Cu+-exporting ATPase